MSPRRLHILSFALILGLLAAFGLQAQIRSATLTGTVTDKSAAAVPDAEVFLSNEETGETLQVKTGETGIYLIPYLAAGRYTLNIRKQGFASAKQSGILLGTGQTLRADLSLDIGAVETAVSVEASALSLQTESATVQNSIGSEVIKTIPNLNHNPLFYASLQPGVVGRASFNDSTNVNSFGLGVEGRRFFSAISVNGAQSFSADIQVDGLSVQGSAWNETAIIPNQEGLQEVRTVTNSYSAEYGRGSGLVQMATKTGTNEYHGSAFYRGRNEALNANRFENNARELARTPFKVHSFGASAGGPVLKNRLFFFASYEGLRHKRALDYVRTVPTEAERVGDFSRTIVNAGGAARNLELYDPSTVTLTAPNTYRRNPIPGNDMRRVSGLIDPNILKFYSFYPAPNRAPDDVFGANNFKVSRQQEYDRTSVNARVDARFGSHSLYASFGVNRGGITTPGAWGPDNPFYSQFQFIGQDNSDDNPFAQIGSTLVLTPSLVADIRFGLTRINTVNMAYPGASAFDYSAFGIPQSIQAINAVPNGSPEVGPGATWTALSRTSSLYKQEAQTNPNFNASATWIRGRWTHKFGADARVFLSNYSDPAYAMQILTLAGLTAQYTDALGTVLAPAGVSLNAANQGWQPASMLSGYGRIQVQGDRNPKPAFAQKYLAFYSQNDWKATDRLTVGLGLRWDFQPGPTERYNRFRSVDFSRTRYFDTPGYWNFPGVNGSPRNLYENTYDNFGPRASIAYRTWKDTVIRAGYGLTYLPSNTGYFATGGFYGMDAFAPTTLNDNSVIYGSTPNGVPVGKFNQVNAIVPALGANPDAPQFYGVSNFAYFPSSGFTNSSLQQWNLTVERKFGKDWLASLGYVASKGSHLPTARLPINSTQLVNPSTLANCRQDHIARAGSGNYCTDLIDNPYQTPGQPPILFGGSLRNARIQRILTLQPYPAVGGSGFSTTEGWSTYHSMQANVTRSYANGLQFNANYVWSKSMAFNMSEAQSNGFGDGYGYAGTLDMTNYRNNYTLTPNDTPHRFVASVLYELPVGKGRRFEAANPIVSALVSDWRVSSAFLAQSGNPFEVTGANAGALNGRPNRVSGQPVEVPKELQRWYDSPNTADRTVTLPSGRRMIVCRYCFLKYNPDAFRAATVQVPDGRFISDAFWYGDSAPTFGDIRQPGLHNINLTVDRAFRLTERVRFEFSAQASNLFNHMQLRPIYTSGLGSVQLRNDAANGLFPGSGTNDNFGTITLAPTSGNATFDPRQIEFHLRIRF